jgi:hypothetical protein
MTVPPLAHLHNPATPYPQFEAGFFPMVAAVNVNQNGGGTGIVGASRPFQDPSGSLLRPSPPPCYSYGWPLGSRGAAERVPGQVTPRNPPHTYMAQRGLAPAAFPSAPGAPSCKVAWPQWGRLCDDRASSGGPSAGSFYGEGPGPGPMVQQQMLSMNGTTFRPQHISNGDLSTQHDLYPRSRQSSSRFSPDHYALLEDLFLRDDRPQAPTLQGLAEVLVCDSCSFCFIVEPGLNESQKIPIQAQTTYSCVRCQHRMPTVHTAHVYSR